MTENERKPIVDRYFGFMNEVMANSLQTAATRLSQNIDQIIQRKLDEITPAIEAGLGTTPRTKATPLTNADLIGTVRKAALGTSRNTKTHTTIKRAYRTRRQHSRRQLRRSRKSQIRGVEKVSWSNILLSYEPIRKGLLELEKLDNGSDYEKAAVNHYLGNSIRKAFKLETDPTPDSVHALCKAEITQAFPNAEGQELTALMKTRNSKIERLTDQIAQDSHVIVNRFFDGLVEKGTRQFEARMNAEFTPDAIDALIDFKLSQLEPSLQKAILEKIHDKNKEEKQK